MSSPTPARTYNQYHVPRKYTPGKRRMSIYWTWSYPWETQRDPAAMENRFSTMTEVRTVVWPNYETPEYSAAQFLQGIAGTLELFHRSTLSFQQIAGEATGHPVAVFQRIDQAGCKQPIDERIKLPCLTRQSSKIGRNRPLWRFPRMDSSNSNREDTDQSFPRHRRTTASALSVSSSPEQRRQSATTGRPSKKRWLMTRPCSHRSGSTTCAGCFSTTTRGSCTRVFSTPISTRTSRTR